MSSLRTMQVAAMLMALGMGAHDAPLRNVERAPIDPDALQRKLTKAEKKRAKRAARNLRLATTQPEDSK